MKMQDKVILVTGGAKRVGAVLCRHLARAGAHLAIHYNTSEKEASALREDLSTSGSEAQTYRCDLANVDEIRRMITEVIDRQGRIDGLVGNASTYYRTPFFDVTEDQWDEILAVNLKSYFFLCQEMGRHMKEQGAGRIVLVSDVSGELAWPNYFPYTISKAGLNHLVRGLAKIMAPEVLVNGIAPGTVLPSEQSTEKDMAFFRERTLLKRIGTPEEVANVVVFLLAEATYMTGAILPVDGGFRFEGR